MCALQTLITNLRGNVRTCLCLFISGQFIIIFILYVADIPGNTRQFISKVNHDCRDFKGVLNRCRVWKDMGFCFKYRRQMQHVCNRTCQYCGEYSFVPLSLPWLEDFSREMLCLGSTRKTERFSRPHLKGKSIRNRI